MAPRRRRSCSVRDEVTIVVQVNGKRRDQIVASTGRAGGGVAGPRAGQREHHRHLNGHEIVKEIVVPGKLVNLVVR